MTRPSRTLFDPGCYHINTRGNQKREIFRDNADYKLYLSMLKYVKRKYGFRLYAYCLMKNHIHLLIELDDARIMSKCMQSLNRGYTAYFNNQYQTVGHLWQGRFRSKPILKGEYLIHCATYIECNPVRAGIVQDPADYLWSSYRERCLVTQKDMLDEIRVVSLSNTVIVPFSALES